MMWVRAVLPEIAGGAAATVARLHARVGERLATGSALLDVDLDLSGGIARDCPPTATCRIILAEPLWLRGFRCQPGDPLAASAPLADLSDTADAPDTPPARTARLSLVAVIHHDDWWSDEAPDVPA